MRVSLEHRVTEEDWIRSKFDELNLMDAKRLQAVNHMHAYQRKMARAFSKRVKSRGLKKGDMVVKMIRCLVKDPRCKFRPNWSGPFIIREPSPRRCGLANGLRWESVL